MKLTLTLLVALLLTPTWRLSAAEPLTTPPALWKEYDPNHGDFKEEIVKKFPRGVPWSFAIQARGHHDTEKIGHDTKFWLEKHVLGKEVAWPEHPRSEIRLDADGVPELVITPASPDKVRKIEMFYALKNPVSFARSWRDTPSVRQGSQWIGQEKVSGRKRCQERMALSSEK